MGACEICGAADGLHYTCNECGGRYCSHHRLPENHNCQVLRSKVRFGNPEKRSKQNNRANGKSSLLFLVILCIGILVVAAIVAPNHPLTDIDRPDVFAITGNNTSAVTDDVIAANDEGGPTATQTTTDNANPEENIDAREIESLIFNQVNEIRWKHGLDTLDKNGYAAKYARAHAEDMAKNDYFSHTSLDGQTQKQRYEFCNGGENAAQTWVGRPVKTENGTRIYSTSEELATGIVLQWMNSRPHRVRGILGDPWVAGGVGVAISESGKVYAVFGFCSTHG